MAISEKNPGNLASLFTFLFDKSPLYESHWIIFGRQVARNSGKFFILKKRKKRWSAVCCRVQTSACCRQTCIHICLLSLPSEECVSAASKRTPKSTPVQTIVLLSSSLSIVSRSSSRALYLLATSELACVPSSLFFSSVYYFVSLAGPGPLLNLHAWSVCLVSVTAMVRFAPSCDAF